MTVSCYFIPKLKWMKNEWLYRIIQIQSKGSARYEYRGKPKIILYKKKEKGKRQIKFTTIHNETILTFKTIMYIGLWQVQSDFQKVQCIDDLCEVENVVGSS